MYIYVSYERPSSRLYTLMTICICMYIYTYMYVCDINVGICVYAYVNIYMYVYVYIYIYVPYERLSSCLYTLMLFINILFSFRMRAN